MKKLIFLTTILLGMVLLIPIFAQSSVGDIWFVPSDPIAVEVGTEFRTEIHANTGTQQFCSYSIEITYNPDIISPNTSVGNSSVEAGPDGFVTSVNLTSPGILEISGFNANGKGPGDNLNVLIISWNADTQNPDSIDDLGITIDYFKDPASNNIGVPTGIDGAVDVFILGDVTEDGSVTINDSLAVAQYYVGLNPQLFLLLH